MNNFTHYSLIVENDTVLCVCVCVWGGGGGGEEGLGGGACVRAVSTNVNVLIMSGKLCCSEIFIGLFMCFSRREWRRY